jgi:GNAT superfamily N-acetyltransferase
VSTTRYPVERLRSHHNRTVFSCGEVSLDDYLRQRARQDDDRNVAKVFVLHDPELNRIAGYCTLSASAIALENVPTEVQRKLPRYPLVPVILLGRLAIDLNYRNQGLGEALLFDALRRALDVGTQQIAATAVVVDAFHDRARSFYEQYGFMRLADDEYRLLLPMTTIAVLS